MVEDRVIQQERNVVVVDELSDYFDPRRLLLYDVVLEERLGVEQILMIVRIIVLLILSIFFRVLGRLRLLLVLLAHVRRQNNNLLGLFYVDAVIGALLQRATLDEVDLLEEAQLLPLL